MCGNKTKCWCSGTDEREIECPECYVRHREEAKRFESFLAGTQESLGLSGIRSKKRNVDFD